MSHEARTRSEPLAERLERYEADGAALRALLALDAGGMASWRWDFETDTVTGDAQLAELFGFGNCEWPVPFATMSGRLHPNDREDLLRRIENAASGGGEFVAEFRVRRSDAAAPNDPGAWRWLAGRGRRIAVADGAAPTAMIGVNWDIAAKKANEDRLRMTALEMDHRIKNAFAVMRALVNIGRRRATDLDSFASDLGAQIQAMADGHEVAARLSRENGNPRSAIPIAEIVEVVIAPWISAEPHRVSLSLDPDPCIESCKVSGLTMLLHELVTNAVKYGGLRSGDGELRIALEPASRAGQPAARLVWQEKARPPIAPDEPSERTSGFGSLLIEHCMSVLGAAFERDLRASGLVMTVAVPVAVADGV